MVNSSSAEANTKPPRIVPLQLELHWHTTLDCNYRTSRLPFSRLHHRFISLYEVLDRERKTSSDIPHQAFDTPRLHRQTEFIAT